MDRRAFLRRLGFGTVAAAAAATGVLDLERLLWVPGEKTIFVPPPPTIEPLSFGLTRGDIFTIEGQFAFNPVTRRQTKHLQQFVVVSDVIAGTTLNVERVYPSVVLPDRKPISGRRVKPFRVGQTITLDCQCPTTA